MSALNRRFAPLLVVLSLGLLTAGCEAERLTKEDLISLDCAKFRIVNEIDFNTHLGQNPHSCIKSSHKNYEVLIDYLTYHSDRMPVLIYLPIDGFDYIVVQVHGGPRSLVTLKDNPIDSPFADERAALMIPVYMGSLNRTIYPAPEFETAVAGIRLLLNRLSHFRTVILAESAGAYLVSLLSDAAFRRMVLVRPALASPRIVHDRILEMKCQTEKNASGTECRFGSMFGRSAIDGRQIEIEGHDNLKSFFGHYHYENLAPGTVFVKSCPFMILDQTDRRIGFDLYQDEFDASCYLSLTRIGGFSHETFVNPKGPMAVWEKIRVIGKGGYAPPPP